MRHHAKDSSGHEILHDQTWRHGRQLRKFCLLFLRRLGQLTMRGAQLISTGPGGHVIHLRRGHVPHLCTPNHASQCQVCILLCHDPNCPHRLHYVVVQNQQSLILRKLTRKAALSELTSVCMELRGSQLPLLWHGRPEVVQDSHACLVCWWRKGCVAELVRVGDNIFGR